jgi:hypothetical protein
MNKDDKTELLEQAMLRAFRSVAEEPTPSLKWRAGLMDAVRDEAQSIERQNDIPERKFETILFRAACAVAGVAAAVALASGITIPQNSTSHKATTTTSFDEDIQTLYSGDAFADVLRDGENGK